MAVDYWIMALVIIAMISSVNIGALRWRVGNLEKEIASLRGKEMSHASGQAKRVGRS